MLLALFLFLMYWRFRVGMARFFDVDEFSYLHWVINFAKGQRPYVDFFLIFPPVFLWIFAPLWWLFGGGIQIFYAARVASYLVFIANLAILGLLFASLRSRRWILLPLTMLAFLPMPYDKFLEFRPDNVSTMAAFAGLLAMVQALRLRGALSRRWWIISGVLYGISLSIFPKTLPFAAVACFVSLGHAIAIDSVLSVKQYRLYPSRVMSSSLALFLGGMVAPAIVVFLYLLILGDIPLVMYSIFVLPFESTDFGGIMEPHLFFFPNGSFYGGVPGVTMSYLANHAVWAIGIMVGIVRLFTPFVTARGDKRLVWAEMLVGCTFFSVVALYVMFYPQKHTQYLIPVALFVVFYAADLFASLLDTLWRRIPTGHNLVVVALFIGMYTIVLARSAVQTNTIKLAWNNSLQVSQASWLQQMVPTGATVFDLEGRMVFWDDAYYICCVPFGEYIHNLSLTIPPVHEVLEREAIPFLWQEHTRRIYSLPIADRVYIQNNYYTIPEWGDTLWIRNGVEVPRVFP